MPDILPTGHCFDDAMDFLSFRLGENSALVDSLILVHGILVGQNGVRYAHGWVEEGDLCWNAGLLAGRRVFFAQPSAEFYERRHVEIVTKYTMREAWIENCRTEHYGPWQPAYLDLCGVSGGAALGSSEVHINAAIALEPTDAV